LQKLAVVGRTASTDGKSAAVFAAGGAGRRMVSRPPRKTKTEVNPMRNLSDPSEMPIGLTMAFAENTEAMRRFASMSEAERRGVLARARSVQSKEEMRAFVQSLIK